MTSKLTVISICIMFILITGIITCGIVINNINESPYKQCLNVCAYSDKLECAKICTTEFKEAISDSIEKLIPLVERILEKKL